VSVEFDFYTAVDDLKPEDTAGADMLGTVEFNSACYYRYANLDAAQLTANLQGDGDLARRAAEAFLRASITAVPAGKQHSMAAQNPPSLVFLVARHSGLWSLANAFAKPVRPSGASDLIGESVVRLDRYWGQLTRMYGQAQIVGAWDCTLEDIGLTNLRAVQVESVDALVDKALAVLTTAGDAA
jgi:CRISPR system Cascade subunit CasC